MCLFSFCPGRHTRHRPKTHRFCHSVLFIQEWAHQLLVNSLKGVVIHNQPTVIQAGHSSVRLYVAYCKRVGCCWAGVGLAVSSGIDQPGNRCRCAIGQGIKRIRMTIWVLFGVPSVYRHNLNRPKQHTDAMRKGICRTLSGVHIHLTHASGSCFTDGFLIIVDIFKVAAKLKQNTIFFVEPGPAGPRALQIYCFISLQSSK